MATQRYNKEMLVIIVIIILLLLAFLKRGSAGGNGGGGTGGIAPVGDPVINGVPLTPTTGIIGVPFASNFLVEVLVSNTGATDGQARLRTVSDLGQYSGFDRVGVLVLIPAGQSLKLSLGLFEQLTIGSASIVLTLEDAAGAILKTWTFVIARAG